MKDKTVFAFVHIEKAAGTTLNHILRNNFFPNYIDVRPLKNESTRIFKNDDLNVYMKINPCLKCISGHSIIPENLFVDNIKIKYFTVLRNPVHRYVSQFLHLVKIKSIKNDFEFFLSHSHFNNYQTKKIAGKEDLDSAKSILSNKMIEVGAVEEFDSFLLRLKKSLHPIKFDPTYTKKNITGSNAAKASLFDEYENEILHRNELDIKLYNYVLNQLIPERNNQYGQTVLKTDLERFRRDNVHTKTHVKNYADYIIRKVYYEPITGLIRKKSGMPAKGSY
ncbi:sulfotransferase family 2 domain-containing protein [uncultured Desulfobacter sp.]|uniref:sulfotransferase family 2 domain-containing protein n=1 Tax=uncultured Desulfobacter sp. TaxID=240139 RepID=UPI0029F5768B|nr:sulfotransferase family 2 domain-containing protein [uncultured Desulfobacter sp.]